MRLIDADEVVETLLCTPDVEEIFLDLAQKRRLDYLHNVEESDVVDFARDIVKAVIGVIKTSTTVDAEPVRHGRWIKEIDYEEIVDIEFLKCTCSICGWVTRTDKTIGIKYNYCPNCGAKMDEDFKEETE